MLKNSLVLIFLILIVNVGCASKMLKKSPELAKNQRFYHLDEKKMGRIFAIDCKNKIRDRECKQYPVFNLWDEWAYFSNGFVLVPYQLLFPN